MEGKDQRLEQLLNGINKLCAGRTDCNGCPFYSEECVFGEPKPADWLKETVVEEQVEVAPEAPAKVEEPEVKEEKPAEVSKAPEEDDDDSVGTWLLSTTMGSVFTKYVFICSKCGYKKESVFSIPPVTFCPECEKRKAEQ